MNTPMEGETRDGRAFDGVCCAAVVTKASLEEFWILKSTFEMFHKAVYPWFVRCDEESRAAMAGTPEIRCHVFSRTQSVRPEMTSLEFREIMSQKMNAMEDAWRERNWDAVLYLDADIIVTSSFASGLLQLPAQVILSPHYLAPQWRAQSIAIGRFNGGFAAAKSPAFHEWWRDALLEKPGKFLDQACLVDAPRIFDVAELDQRANIGWWRKTGITHFPPIPHDCLFFHVHLFQPINTLNAFVQRSFVLHCLEFLYNSQNPDHHRVVETIVSRDSSGWYAGALEEIKYLRRSNALLGRLASTSRC